MTRLMFAACVCTLLCARVALAQPPTLGHTLPAAVQPGKSVDVVLHGGNLAGATGLWTSFPATIELTPGIERNGSQPGSVSYRVTLGPDVPLGVGGIRVATGKGLSNLRLILIDDLPSIAKAGNNKSPQTAQPLSLPIAVDGACDGESSDFYKLSVTAGQRIAVDVYARRLGSALDPMIRLLSADGRELAFSDDEPATGADSRFGYKFDTAGDYYLEIRDIRFQGGGGHRYRLRIGDFPLPGVAYPLAAQKGASAGIQLAGKHVELPGPVTVNVPAEVPGERVSVAAAYSAGQGSAWTSVVASSVPEQLESEPNDLPEQSTAVALPGAINGRLEKRGDRDFYQFEAKQGQRLVFSGQTRTLGSPADLFLRLYNAEGGVLAEVDDSGADEGILNYTFSADGVFRLRVEDTNRAGGPESVYRIQVEPYQPGFSLAAASEVVNAPQQGVFVLKVTAARRDYNGPITLGIEGAEGCTLAGNVIPEGKPETTMSVTLGSSPAAGQYTAIKVVGTAKIGESDFRAVASTLGALRGGLSGLPYPPAALDGSVGLGVGPVFPQFFQLAAATGVLPLVKANATGSLKVQLSKSNGFDDAVNVAVEGLPAGVSAKPATIAKGAAEAAIELTAAQAIPPGKYPIKLVGSATFQNQPQRFVVEGVTIQGPPLAIALAPAGPLPVGGKSKAVLSLAGEVAPLAPAAVYQGGVTRGAEGPRGMELAGFEADNRAVSFSGIDKAPGDDRLTAELPVLSGGDYSIEFWLYNTRDLSQPNSPAISGYLFSRAGTPNPGNAQPGDHLGIGGVESSPRDRLFFYDGQTLVPGRTTLKLNTWYHVALVRAGDKVTVYLNGDTANPEIQATAAKGYTASSLCLGTRSDGYSPFQGRLDEVAFFDAPLSAEQVQAHVAAAKAAAARDAVLKDAPVAYWRLDESEGGLAQSSAPAKKRLVNLAWKNMPAGVTLPAQVVLADGQDKAEIELAAGDAVAPAKLEGVTVAGTTTVAEGNFTAESPPVVLEVNKP